MIYLSSSSPLVSVIIPFYNCAYVAQAIESVLNQTYPFIELIVVNDGSDKYVDLLSPYFSKIIYIEQINKGTAAAINRGIKQSKGEYLVWLSSDDLIYPQKIENQLQFMKEKNALISFTNFNYINKEQQITKYNVGTHFNNSIEVLRALQYSNPINGCTVMMSRKIIEDIGYFTEDLKYTQDYEYWIRAGLQFPIYYYPITLTNYRVHEDMGTIRYNQEATAEYLKVQNKYKPIIEEFIEGQMNSQNHL